jgi:hypothetical protein
MMGSSMRMDTMVGDIYPQKYEPIYNLPVEGRMT